MKKDEFKERLTESVNKVKKSLSENDVATPEEVKITELPLYIKRLKSLDEKDKAYIDMTSEAWKVSTNGLRSNFEIRNGFPDRLPDKLAFDHLASDSFLEMIDEDSNHLYFSDIFNDLSKGACLFDALDSKFCYVYHATGTKIYPTNCNSAFFASNLTEIDLNSFDVSECSDFEDMFSYSDFKTINCKQDWTKINPKVLEAKNMFEYCRNLPGWSADKISGKYAKPISEGGYFTTPDYIDTQGENWQIHIPEYSKRYGRPIVFEIVNGTLYGFRPTRTSRETFGDFECFDVSEKQDWSVYVAIGEADFHEQFLIYYTGNVLGVKNARDMFSKTPLFEIMDLDSLDITDCTDFEGMFKGQSELTSIYCSKDWTKINPKVLEAKEMFNSNKFGDRLSGEYAKPNSKGGNFTPCRVYIDARGNTWRREINDYMLDDLLNVRHIDFIEGIPDDLTSDLKEYKGYKFFDVSENKDFSVVATFEGEFLDESMIIYYKKDSVLKVKNASYMFSNPISVYEDINVNNLDISECTNFEEMFGSAFDLHTIYCNHDWTEINPIVVNTRSMFDTIMGFEESGAYAKPKSKGGNFTEI